MINIENYTKIQKCYDCLECGQKMCVSETNGYGTCQTPGCLYHNPIQYVYYPNWNEPKVSRAGRVLLFL